MRTFVRFSFAMAMAGLAAADVTPAMLYKQHCALCHDNPGVTRAPSVAVMRQMAPEAVVNALENGLMKEQGKLLAAAERRSLAEFLTAKTIGSAAAPATGFCENRNAAFDVGGNA